MPYRPTLNAKRSGRGSISGISVFFSLSSLFPPFPFPISTLPLPLLFQDFHPSILFPLFPTFPFVTFSSLPLFCPYSQEGLGVRIACCRFCSGSAMFRCLIVNSHRPTRLNWTVASWVVSDSVNWLLVFHFRSNTKLAVDIYMDPISIRPWTAQFDSVSAIWTQNEALWKI